MEMLTTSPWNVVLFSAFCLIASFLIIRIRDGFFLWLASGVIVVPAGAYVAKVSTLMAFGGFVAGTVAGLLLFIWIGDRAARRPEKRPDDEG